MMQASHEARLAFELFAQAFVGKECLFKRNRAVETLIDGFVDGAHAALPELAHDTITTL